MPQNVWCDAKDCIFYDEEWGECDVYRLKVEGGVCVGHPRSGRNVTGNDVVEKLKDENEKLRDLVRGLRYCAIEAYGMCYRTAPGDNEPFECCPLFDYDAKEYRCVELRRELGIEVD